MHIYIVPNLPYIAIQAVKALDLGLLDTEKALAQLRAEIFIMCQLDHPNIVRLEEVYESHAEIYLVQELCHGGELFDRLDDQPDYHYTEKECARLIKQMLCAVRYLHSKGIIHRDLKLENFLFSSRSKDAELKMIDFGLSKHFVYGEVQNEAVGTPYTVAPEVIRGSYAESCDIWAIGVISFLLLSGEPPFGGCGGPEPLLTVRSNILRGEFRFEPSDIWDLVSQDAKDFISALLIVDPKLRPTARIAQRHQWLMEWESRSRTEGDNVLNPNVIKALVGFKELSDMRKFLCEVLSFTLLPYQIKDLRKEFEKMDTDGSGEISLSGLKEVLTTNASEGSLGALTEEEVEDIFNALRIEKSKTRIRWHEFIAAGLSQCEVDDHNLWLAFDRLDSDHKGVSSMVIILLYLPRVLRLFTNYCHFQFITLTDMLNLVGNNSQFTEENMQDMWGESIKAANCNEARVTYDEFLRLMKGQTREKPRDNEGSFAIKPNTFVPSVAYDEGEFDEGPISMDDDIDPFLGTPEGSLAITLNTFIPSVSYDDGEIEEGPISMDDDMDPFPGIPNKPGLLESSSQNNSQPSMETNIGKGDQPALSNRKPRLKRLKSSSYDPKFTPNVHRALALPECNHDQNMFGSKNTLSTLQANRELYRAHRHMRLAVLEASKRFEEQQPQFAERYAPASEEDYGFSPNLSLSGRHIMVEDPCRLTMSVEKEKMSGKISGLIMRRVENKTVSSEEVMKLLEQNRKEQQSLMTVAARRSGRGRKTNRKKTISDMTEMMAS